MAVKPRYGAYVVAVWLAGIVVDLLAYSIYYDIALRDFGAGCRQGPTWFSMTIHTTWS